MKYTPVAVFGADGQVGSALMQLLGNKAIALVQADADFTKPETLAALLEKITPSAVINAAAYTQVDKAEEEENLALKINADAPGALASYCRKAAIPFVHYSTDYVFAGDKEGWYVEEDRVNPVNAYGRTKAEGEKQVMETGGKNLIFRTSWVYDDKGKNFLNTMLRLGKEREILRVVNDQHGAPTYAMALAEATLQALENATAQHEFPSGIYHLCNGGTTTWHGFAEAIFSEAKARNMALKVHTVEPIPASHYPTPAARPVNSKMSCLKAEKILSVKLPDWQESMKACLKLKCMEYV